MATSLELKRAADTDAASRNGRILGPNGQPFERPDLDDEMGAYDSIFAQSFRFAPFNPDALLSARGYTILRDQLVQSAVLTPLNIVRTNVLSKGWEVQPSVADEANADYAEAKQYADALSYDLNNIRDDKGNVQDFRHVLWELMSAIHYGFRVTSIGWKLNKDGPNKGKYGFRGFYAKPCKQIGFDLDSDTLAVQHITSYTPMTGYQMDVPVESALRYTFAPEDGLPYGVAIGRAVYANSWSITNLYRFWNICLEVFGTPFILAKAPPGKAMRMARAAIKAIRQGGAPVLPDNVQADFIQTATGGESGFQAAIEHHQAAISKCYEHSVLASGEGEHGATSAGSNVHQDTSEGQNCFIRTDVESVMNGQLVYRWMRYNVGADRLHLSPKISLGEWDSVDSANMANAFATNISAGVLHPSEPQVREKQGLKPITPDAQKAMEQDKADAAALQQKQLDAAAKQAAPASSGSKS